MTQINTLLALPLLLPNAIATKWQICFLTGFLELVQTDGSTLNSHHWLS